MDQIFDRLERLFKSWTAADADDTLGGSPRRSGSGRSGDPDLDSAMDELDDFLDRDREAAEARERERKRREEEARARAGNPRPSPFGPHPRLVEAFKVLGLPYGTPFPEVKSAYKRLLKENHPDRHGADPASQKRATELSSRINAAYQLIETWTVSGKVAED